MSPLLSDPRQGGDLPEALDQQLARALCQWLDCQDEWLQQSIMAVSEALREGHSCLNLAFWAGQVRARNRFSEDSREETWPFPPLEDWLQRLATLKIAPEDNAPLVLDRERLYLRRYWRFETELAGEIHQRLQQTPSEVPPKAADTFARLFPNASGTGTNGTDWQGVAAANALFQRFSIIAGGPGTGKTFTVTRLLALLAESLSGQSEDPTAPSQPLRIRMAAPTGKAAQRLGESLAQARASLAGLVSEDTLALLPQEATTLHRLLGVIPGQIHFRHNRERPLRLDILLVDEVSMIDLPMMTRLFRALPPQARIVFLGDPNQLPSVAAGSVLADLAPRSGYGYTEKRRQQLAGIGCQLPEQTRSNTPLDYLSYLHESRRFTSDGGIGKLAEQVLNGQPEESLATLQSGDQDLHWLPQSQLDERLMDWVRQWYQPVIDADNLEEAFQRLARFRLLCPTRVGRQGAVSLNEQILQRLNPGRQPFFRGQPLMITENHYGVGLFNGDIGLVWPEPDGSGETLFAWFPNSEGHRPLALGRLPAHETVYAMTIHKTQGSEFERVALVLPEQSHNRVSRELLYTGLTRARSAVTVCGEEPVWKSGVSNPVERHSGLEERVTGALMAGIGEHPQ
ncbi:MAG: exodeoxyribonuclease V subunit alpha [Oleiphilaceae bacterium]|nr:exodeoxyribonuclease V subunit alpha [Oleiphilaceae bacterium]